MTRLPSFGMNRRTFLQVSAAGVVTATALGGSRAVAAPYSKFTWISPRGTLEVLDDFGFWMGKKLGYFDDLGVAVDMQAGPSDGTATVKFVDVGQADMGFPSPGIFSFALENGMNLKSAFHWGALDTFSIAFRKGEGSNDLRQLEGKTILLGSAAWQSIVDPMLAVPGVDVTKVKYVEAGWPTWGTALAGGGDAALAWEACAPSGCRPGSISSTGWACSARRSSPTPMWCAADLEDPDRKAFLDKYLRAWSMGLEASYHTRWPRCTPCSSSSPRWRRPTARCRAPCRCCRTSTSCAATCRSAAGWGDHDMAAWQTFFDKVRARPDQDPGQGRGRVAMPASRQPTISTTTR